MATGLPIVFLHYGCSHYLPFTAGRAKMMNIDSPVILIGDAANEKFLPFVQHVPMNRYAKQAVELEKHYKHLSPNGQGYELFCFLRWFILRDFMKAHDLTEIIHLDSDVLINVNVTRERSNWLDYDLTLVRSVCAGNMFVNGTRTLEELCDIIWDLYTGPESDRKLGELYAKAQVSGGGVCDMSALQLLCDASPGRVGEMTGVQPDDSYWDANFRQSEGFEIENGMKKMTWLNGLPFGRHINSGRDIFFKSLHFQGKAKDHLAAEFRKVYPASAAA